MLPQLILFDCDGTLVDSQHQIVGAMQQALSDCTRHAPSDSEVRAIIGLSLRAAIERLAPQLDAESVEQVASRYRHHFLAQEERIALFPGVIETLRHLVESGYWLGIVTGKSKRGLLRVLEQHRIDDLFLVHRTADCCPSKPHPAMVQECMAELGVSPQHTVVIGDARFDIEMAAASGVRALGVSFGVAAPDELLAAGAERVIDHFDHLCQLFPPLHP